MSAPLSAPTPDQKPPETSESAPQTSAVRKQRPPELSLPKIIESSQASWPHGNLGHTPFPKVTIEFRSRTKNKEV